MSVEKHQQFGLSQHQKSGAGFTPLRDLIRKITNFRIGNLPNQSFHNNRQAVSLTGFTLIELLVVIAIIGLLASVVLVSLNSARSKARDAKRIADFKQISTALELFYDAEGKYPQTAGAPTWDGHWDIFKTCLTTGASCGFTVTNYSPVLKSFSQDPLDNPATLSDADPTYYYGYPSGCSDGQSYRLAVYLENNDKALSSDVDGSFYNNNLGCEDSNKGYCIGIGTCAGW